MFLYGLKETYLQKLRQIFFKYADIDQAILYGFRAKGTYREGSDIDIALRGNKLTDSQLGRIEDELDMLLLPYKIDISLISAIDNEELLDHIKRKGRVLYDKGRCSGEEEGLSIGSICVHDFL